MTNEFSNGVDVAPEQRKRLREFIAASFIHPELKELLAACVDSMSREAVATLTEAFEREAEWLTKFEAELRLADARIATAEAALREDERAIVQQRIEAFTRTLQAGGSTGSGNASL